MGSYTDATLRAFAEESGIKPAEGRQRERLEQLQRLALDLITLVELERSGVRDGNGRFHGCDPISNVMQFQQEEWASYCREQEARESKRSGNATPREPFREDFARISATQ